MSKKFFRNLIFVVAFFIVLSFCFSLGASVLANDDITAGLDTVAGASGAGLQKADLKVVIGKIIKVILGFLGVIALCLTLYGGYLYMTSGGEADKVDKAKKYLINAAIGLAIILLSYAIVSFVISKLQGAVTDDTYYYACSDGKDNDKDGTIDFPGDAGCTSATHYTEYSGLDIYGEAYLRVKAIVPVGQQKIINVHPRISFNQAVVSTPEILKNNIIISGSAETVDQNITVKPVKVTEVLGNGAQILAQIKEDDGTINPNWVICSATYLGETPMLVEYDVSGITTEKSGKLKFESSSSGDQATMDIFCGKTEADLVKIKENWLPPNGNNEIDLDAACLGGDKIYIKWARTGTNCLKFDYMWLDIVESVPSTVDGTFVVKNSGRLVEFVPAGVCDQADSSKYALKKDTEYTITIKAGATGLTSADGDPLICNATDSVCTAKFTTGDVCDVTPPKVYFNALNKSMCKFPEESIDSRDIPFGAEDDAGLALISLYVDHVTGQEDAIGEVSLPSTPLIYSGSLPWEVNVLDAGGKQKYALGEHWLMLEANDVDGNSSNKKTNVYLRPDFCCDDAGEIICGDPACGACDEGPCTQDSDCANGYCEIKEGETTGVCKSLPIIYNANPKEGIDGNFVTIYGNGFSSYDINESRVLFSEGVEAGQKYTLPAELGCDSAGAWTNNQIIVKVPEGVGTGPIKVVTKNKDNEGNNRFDDTEDDDEGWQGDFVRNPILRYPGLCAPLVPSDGVAGTLVQLSGEKFGNPPDGQLKAEDDAVYFGDTEAAVTILWSDTKIEGARVPQIDKGIYDVVVGKGERCSKVKDGCESGAESCIESCEQGSPGCSCFNVLSNPVSFTVRNPGALPTITEITPKTCKKADDSCCIVGSPDCTCVESAPVKQMISIAGSNFGDAQGQVILKLLEDNGEGGFVEATDEDGNPLPAFIADFACGAGSWSDTEIIVKVPEANKLQGDQAMSLSPGNYWVQVITSQSLPSNNRFFVVNTNAPGPGLCGLSPSNGPAATEFTVTGENFGTKDLYNLTFVKDKDNRIPVNEAGDIVWGAETIEKARVPAEAITGGVRLEGGDCSVASNAIEFKVGACKNDESCKADQFCCSNGVCTNKGTKTTKEDVCGSTIVTHESEYAWVMSTGVIPKIPAVIERNCFVTDFATDAGYRQSPSPKKEDKLACPNGLISATFNMLINEASLNGNVIIRRCLASDSETPCDFTACTAPNCLSSQLSNIAPSDVGTQPASIVCTKLGAKCEPGTEGCVCAASNENMTSFSLFASYAGGGAPGTNAYPNIIQKSGNKYNLFANSWYQVEIVGGPGGVAANSFAPGVPGKTMTQSYVWNFKTKATDCVPDNFLMTPSKGKITSVQQIQKYWVTGMYQCQEISLIDKPWVWTVPDAADAQKAEAKGYACLVEPIPGALPYCTAATERRNDIGVYATRTDKLVCQPGGCSQFSEGCECNATIDLETTESNLVQILANAVVPADSLLYEKGADLEINFSEPRVTSYYPKCKEACINAQMGVNFNTKMKESVVENQNNVKVYSCDTEECTVISALPGVTLNLNYLYAPAAGVSFGQNLLTIDLVNNMNLLPNRYHRVVISGDMESISGVKLIDLNYHHDPTGVIPGAAFNSFSWVFKTKNDPNQCVINSVGVTPGGYVAGVPGETINYAVQPASAPDKCSPNGQLLNPLNYDWDWSTNDPDNGATDGAPLATITNNVYNTQVSTTCNSNCLLKGSVKYRAVCGDGTISTGEECEPPIANCNIETCLWDNFAACTPAELSGSSACCGNGVKNGNEECDLGAEYLDKDKEACDPTTAEPEDNCVLVSKSKACSAGCLNTGTADGYTCGNKVPEPGEDVDDGNNKAGDGVNNKCLNEGAQVKFVAGLPICGNGTVDAGEECDSANPLCNEKCLITGFPSCVNPGENNCCGNSIVEDLTGAGLSMEECEKTACFKEVTCPTQVQNMAKCDSGDSGCTKVGNQCFCAEVTACPAGGKMQQACAVGEAGCVCEFPAWCTNKCTNIGSDSEYGSLCGNGLKELGEDSGCEALGTGTKGSPYQQATINTEKNTFNVYSVLLRLTPDIDSKNPDKPPVTYSLTKKIIAQTLETIQGQPQTKTGDTDIALRVPKSVYDEAVTASCSAETELFGGSSYSVPSNGAQDVCRNSIIVLYSTVKGEIKGGDSCICTDGGEQLMPDGKADMSKCDGATKVVGCERKSGMLFYYDAEVCANGELSSGEIDEFVSNSSKNWFVKTYNKVIEFVRNLLFKIGLAGPLKHCRGPEMTSDIKVTGNGTEMRGIPAELLLPNTTYKILFRNLKNKCNVGFTDLPKKITFTTGSELCRLDNVAVTPGDLFVMQSKQEFNYYAYPRSGAQNIFPVPGVYSWNWAWESTDTALATINPNAYAAVITTQTKNGQGQIKATATITEDSVAQLCTDEDTGAPCVAGGATCVCAKDQGNFNQIGAKFTGFGNIKVFICDNPWFGDVYNSYGRAIPAEYQYVDGQPTRKKFDLRLETTNNGQLKPSYLVEKEFNAGLFYCRDFGEDKILSDDLPLVGLMSGEFTEIDPKPRFGVYFDRNYDYVVSGANDNLDFLNRDGASETAKESWTISAWVYNDDLPQDRYVRLFYKNLSTDIASVPNQDHVQLGVRRWCATPVDPVCWFEVLNGSKQPSACNCTDENIKRSVVFKIKYGNNIIYRGIRDAAGLLNNGFNQIVLSYNKDSKSAILSINGKADVSEQETASMFVWPRDNLDCKTAGGTICDSGTPGCVCTSEKLDVIATPSMYDKLYVGGLGKTTVPLVSFGGYVDDFRVFHGEKTPSAIKTDEETGLAVAWTFNTDTNSNNGIGAFKCTADYSAEYCTPVSCVKNQPGCTCVNITSQCLPDGGSFKFKHHNITDIAKQKGIFYGDNSGWQELNVDVENQCSNGVDDDGNGLIDTKDHKCTSANDGWESPALFAQYFFVRKDDMDYPSTNDMVPDAISLRIYENPEALPPSLWYKRYAPNPAASVPETKSDCLYDSFGEFCYAGTQDGRTIYVSAANVNGNNVYNNIYLLSYSQNSNPATQNIFGQMVEFLKFNMNVLNAENVNKLKVIRDTKRLQDFVLMHEYLKVYKAQNNGYVPQLESGTLQRHFSNSVWDSWKNELSKAIGFDMPVDPINALYNVPPQPQCFLSGTTTACQEQETNCICDNISKPVLCGTDVYSNPLACGSDEQCAIPGMSCVECSNVYDNRACYNSSTQTFDSLYGYYSILDKTDKDYGKNLTYTYEVNDLDYTKYRLRVYYEQPQLNYKYVPLIETSNVGWDAIKQDPEEIPETPGDAPECMDGIDNDKNGKIDYPNDEGCSSSSDETEDYPYHCKDGLDNDGDGRCDWDGCCINGIGKTKQQCLADKAAGQPVNWLEKDYSCQENGVQKSTHKSEVYPAQCNDGQDNDGDGDIDYCKLDGSNEATCDKACSSEYDDKETKKVLFAFFVDTSGSMRWQDHDPEMAHQDLILSIVNGIDTPAGCIPGAPGCTHIDGIRDVMGNNAYFVLGTSKTSPTEDARRAYFPAGQADHFLGWLDCANGWENCVKTQDIATCNATYNCGGAGRCVYNYCTQANQCSSNVCSSGTCSGAAPVCSSPYIYDGNAYMALRIDNVFMDALNVYDTKMTKAGASVDYDQTVYIVITDADDTYNPESRAATITAANARGIPIHFIYIKTGALGVSNFNFWYRYHGLCAGQACTANTDCASCVSSTSCSNACVNNVCIAPTTEPSVCINDINHQGIWMQGSTAELETKLKNLMSKFTTLPPPPPPDEDELNY